MMRNNIHPEKILDSCDVINTFFFWFEKKNRQANSFDVVKFNS